MFGLSIEAEQKRILREGLIELIGANDTFQRAISYSTNSSQPVERRFFALERLVQEVNQ